MTCAQAGQFFEKEAEMIEDRYCPHSQKSNANVDLAPGSSKRLRDIRDRCLEVGAPEIDEAKLQEEQERELAPEAEEEREIERPAAEKAAKHEVHEDLLNFVSLGELPAQPSNLCPAFRSLRQTGAAKDLDVNMFPGDILVTPDFCRTIQKPNTGAFLCDAYQRPVQWLLSSQPRDWKTVIIISPYEANELLPKIRESGNVTLHLYCARPSQEMRSLDSQDLYPVPSSPTDWSEPFPL